MTPRLMVMVFGLGLLIGSSADPIHAEQRGTVTAKPQSTDPQAAPHPTDTPGSSETPDKFKEPEKFKEMEAPRPQPMPPPEDDKARPPEDDGKTRSHRPIMQDLQEEKNTASLASPSASRLEVISAFEGIGKSQAGSRGLVFFPPDTHGATNARQSGSGLFLEVTNSHVNVYDEATGKPVFDIGLSEFFNETRVMVDPRALYDPVADRWIITAILTTGNDQVTPDTTGGLFLAASKGGDPAAGWNTYFLPLPVGPFEPGDWVDFDGTGQTSSAVVVTGNVFTVVPNKSRSTHSIYVISKDELYNGRTLGAGVIQVDYPGTLTPSIVLDSNDTNYILADNQRRLPSNTLGLFTLGNTADPLHATLSEDDITIPNSYDVPMNPAQPGTDTVLDANDTRFKSATTQHGSTLWAVHDVSRDRTRAFPQFYQIDALNHVAVTTGAWVVSTTSNDFNASIAANQQDDVFVTWTSVDAAEGTQAETRVAGRCHTDPAGTMNPPGVIVARSSSFAAQTGTGAEDNSAPPPAHPVSRWGDYSAVSLDPSGNGTLAWFVNEFTVDQNDWGTAIGSMQFMNCADRLVTR